MANQILSLLSALTVAFTVILLGFVSLKAGYVSKDSSRGIGQLVGKVALPCLLFRAVATTALDTVDLRIVATVAIAKLIALAIAWRHATTSPSVLPPATCPFMQSAEDVASPFFLDNLIH